jgi:predicted nucleic acid-binding Zn ribbon protein
MAILSIGDSLSGFIKNERWQSKMIELRLKGEWAEIMGATIAKYTKNVQLKQQTLIISTEVAALKQELHFGKAQIIKNVNDYFKEVIVKEVVVK